MYEKRLIELMKNDWIENGDYAPPLIGCTEEDLERLQQSQGVKRLPELYRQFMLTFGVKSGGLRGEGYFLYPAIMGPNEQRPNDLAEDVLIERLSRWEQAISSGDRQTLFLSIWEYENQYTHLGWVAVQVGPGWLPDLWKRLRTHSLVAVNPDTRRAVEFFQDEYDMLVFERDS